MRILSYFNSLRSNDRCEPRPNERKSKSLSRCFLLSHAHSHSLVCTHSHHATSYTHSVSFLPFNRWLSSPLEFAVRGTRGGPGLPRLLERGDPNVLKRAQRGLYHGRGRLTGNNISFSHRKYEQRRSSSSSLSFNNHQSTFRITPERVACGCPTCRRRSCRATCSTRR
jgi:hypothetical protein